MERKIGEIFDYNGEWYQCVEELSWGVHCNGCDFIGRICSKLNPKCSPAHHRSDGKSVIFKKLEKVGEPYISSRNKKRYQLYRCFCLPIITKDRRIEIGDANWVGIEIKQNKEDMKEKKQKLGDLVGLYSSGKITPKEFEKGIRELYEKRSNSEKIGKNLKPFDLEAAKAGKPVCTRDGRKARIICFDYKGDSNAYPILALISTSNLSGVPSELIAKYTEDGRYAKYNNVENDEDLMMLSEKKEGWINIYDADTTFRYVDGRVYETKDEAVQKAKEEIAKELRGKNEYVDTIKITWEE